MRWLLDNCDAVKAAAAENDLAFGTIDSWLLHRLTGSAGTHVTDATNASRTMLMDLRTQTWHEPTAVKLGVPMHSLPRIVSCAEEYGVITEGALKGVKLTGCLGDQHAATLGQRCDAGRAKNTYGTGCFMLLNTGENVVESKHGLLTTMAWRLGKDATPAYALEGSVAIAGAGVQWLRDNLGLIRSAADVEPLAASVPDSGGVYFVPAFSGLFAPRWRPDARGVCVGLTQFTTKAHLARAPRAICFQTVDVLEAMRKDASDLDMTALHVDGGATANGLMMQTQADLLGLRVFPPGERGDDRDGRGARGGCRRRALFGKSRFRGYTRRRVNRRRGVAEGRDGESSVLRTRDRGGREGEAVRGLVRRGGAKPQPGAAAGQVNIVALIIRLRINSLQLIFYSWASSARLVRVRMPRVVNAPGEPTPR